MLRGACDGKLRRRAGRGPVCMSAPDVPHFPAIRAPGGSSRGCRPPPAATLAPPMRVTAFLAMAGLLAASAVGATPPLAAAPPQPKAAARVARVVPPAKRELTTESASSVDRVDTGEAWAVALGPIEVLNRNTNARGKIRLYDEHGVLDRGEARAFMRIAGSTKLEPGRRERRRRAPRSARRAARHPRRVSFRRCFDRHHQRDARRCTRQARHGRGARLRARRREGVGARRLPPRNAARGRRDLHAPQDAVRPSRRARAQLPLDRRLAAGRHVARAASRGSEASGPRRVVVCRRWTSPSPRNSRFQHAPPARDVRSSASGASGCDRRRG